MAWLSKNSTRATGLAYFPTAQESSSSTGQLAFQFQICIFQHIPTKKKYGLLPLFTR